MGGKCARPGNGRHYYGGGANNGNGNATGAASASVAGQRNDGVMLMDPPPDDLITCFSVLPSNQNVGDFAAGGVDGYVSWYSTGRLMHTFQAHRRGVNRVMHLCDSNTNYYHGGMFCTASHDGEISLWDWKRNHRASFSNDGDTNRAHEMSVNGLCTQDKHILASGSKDYTVRLWDIQTQKCLASKSILRNVVTNMCTFDRKTFVQSSEDLHLRIWNTETMGSSQVDLRFTEATKTGPDQIVSVHCKDNYILCGTKGFSQGNYEPADVRRFCQPVAENNTFFDSTIESIAFSTSDPGKAFAVSKGGQFKVIGMPDRYNESLTNPRSIALTAPVTSMFSFQKGKGKNTREIVCVASGGPKISVLEYIRNSEDTVDQDEYEFRLLSEAGGGMINVRLNTASDDVPSD